jgi:hypothetical protein
MTGLELNVIAGNGDPCRRCGRESLLTAAVPSGFENGRGEHVGGHFLFALCAVCDQDAPDAGPLITFRTVHEQITEDLAEQFATYAAAWAEHLAAPSPDPDAFEADWQAYLRGDFDEA